MINKNKPVKCIGIQETTRKKVYEGDFIPLYLNRKERKKLLKKAKNKNNASFNKKRNNRNTQLIFKKIKQLTTSFQPNFLYRVLGIKKKY